MKIRRMDHIGINVNDYAAAKAFFLDLGFEVEGEAESESEWLDTIIGLTGAKTKFAMLKTPEGGAKIELIKYYTPPDEQGIQPSAANTLGIRHISLVVDDIDAVVANLKKKGTEIFSEIQQYEDVYKLVYIRGPEGIILELAQELN
ncbi:MAG: VOC family protein [Burkholderiales bacterium]|nr:VOC family protein [Anaerolineae bacterium]